LISLYRFPLFPSSSCGRPSFLEQKSEERGRVEP